ncbi:TRAP transporter small permease [Fulvimarina endophytica]|uniref:TRAP transporter small permease protein n=1 Tax=Fulvimarina endophytica TaxID=2293836 RepID=A0A371X2T7_9HYPH|nr:TRAP transporter small permease [Fulvimarina endophytica]RFC63532.1 TRAP transporter small permease [Fulvimarina endophytica]
MDETALQRPQQAESEGIPAFADAPAGFVLGTVAAVLSAIGTVWIGFLMILIVSDVIGRNFFDAPITGVAEIAGYSVVAIVFLQTAAAVMQGRLTRADFLYRRIAGLSRPVAAALESAFCVTGAIVFALIAWSSSDKLITAYMRAEFFGVQGVFIVPTWPFRAIIVFGSITASLAALYRAFNRTPLPAGQRK